MIQVNKKFLEQQVKILLEIGDSDAATYGYEEAQRRYRLQKKDKTVTKKQLEDKIIKHLRQQNGKNGNQKLEDSVLKTIAFFIIEVLVGAFSSYEVVFGGVKEALQFGFGYDSRINSTINKFKNITAEQASILPFLSLGASDDKYTATLLWRKEIFLEFYKVCDKYAKRMLPLIKARKYDDLADEYKDFVEEMREDVLEKYSISNVDRAMSWAFGGKTSAEKFGNFFNERQLEPTDNDAKSMAKYFIESNLKSSTKDWKSFSSFLEGTIISSHKYLRNKIQGRLSGLEEYIDKQIDNPETRDKSIPGLFAGAAHIKYLEATYNPVTMGIAIADIVISLASTYLMIYTFGASKAVGAASTKVLNRVMLKTIVQKALTGVASNTLSIAFYTYVAGQEKQLILRRLQEYHDSYWSIVNNNQYKYADVFTIPNFGKTVGLLGGSMFDSILNVFAFKDADLRNAIKLRRQDVNKEAWVQKVMSPEHKKELLRLLLHGRSVIETLDLINPKVKKGEYKELFASAFGLEDGIIGSYKKVYNNMFQGQKQYSELINSLEFSDDLAMDFKTSKLDVDSKTTPEQKTNKKLANINKVYSRGKKGEADKILKDILDLFNTMAKSAEMVKKNKQNMSAAEAKMKAEGQNVLKKKNVKDIFNQKASAGLTVQPWMRNVPTVSIPQNISFTTVGPPLSTVGIGPGLGPEPSYDDLMGGVYDKVAPQPKVTSVKAADARQLTTDQVIIVGDSNARPLANKWYKKGKTVKGEGGYYLMDEKDIVAPTVSNGKVPTILRTTKQFFEQKGDSYKPSIAIVHMGYNNPRGAFPAYQEVISYLRDKGVQDIRVIDIKVSGNIYASAAGEKRYMKSIKDLSKKIQALSNQPNVTVIPNNEKNNVGGDKFHFTGRAYANLYNAAMSGISAAPSSTISQATTTTTSAVATSTPVGPQQLRVRNRRATEMISDVSKFLKRELTTSELDNLNKIYETAIQQLSYIDSKEAWNSIRYAYGKKESSNTYQPNKKNDRYKKIRFTGRYQIGPAPYRIARRIVSKYGITMPNFPYINSLKWSPGSQDIYFNDPIAQEASFLGFVLNNKNKVTNEAEDPKDLMGLPGIAHNVGPKSMRTWAGYRKQYRNTKDVQYLYKMWSLQDGNGTPGENFMRILLRQGGYRVPDLPMGFFWTGGSKKNDYKQLANIKKFDPDLGNFIEKNYVKKWKYDARIFAFSEGNYAEKLWNWVTTSGQNHWQKSNKKKFSTKIEDYYNEYGDPIGSPGPQSLPVAATPPPQTTSQVATTPDAAITPEPTPVDQAGGEDSIQMAASPAADQSQDTTAGAVAAPVSEPTGDTNQTQPAAAAARSLEQEIQDVEGYETLKDIIIGYMGKYGPSKSKVISNTGDLEAIFKRMTAGDSKGYQSRKFKELTANVHQTYRETFRGIYNREKAKDTRKANEIMAFLHRPRIIVNIQTDRMLFTNQDDYTLSFEFGKPYGNQVGVVSSRYPFFSPDKFGNGIEKQNLKRIISQNKQLVEKFRDKTRSIGPGMYGERGLDEEEKRIYLKYFDTLYKIYSLASDALEPGGSMMRKALFMDNFASSLYLT